MPDDVVASILSIVREEISVTPARLEKVERRIRLELAGGRHTIRQRPPLDIPIEQIEQRITDKDSIRQIARDLNVARSTIYRRLSKGRKLSRLRQQRN